MDKVFLQKLKATLDAIISQNKALRAEVDALNHSVNDVIIGGLTSAAEEYEDNEKYSNFVDTYKGKYEPYAESCKIIYGDDFDISEDLYSRSKEQENVDEFVDNEIRNLEAKIDALKNVKSSQIDDNTVLEPSEEELMKIAMTLA